MGVWGRCGSAPSLPLPVSLSRFLASFQIVRVAHVAQHGSRVGPLQQQLAQQAHRLAAGDVVGRGEEGGQRAKERPVTRLQVGRHDVLVPGEQVAQRRKRVGRGLERGRVDRGEEGRERGVVGQQARRGARVARRVPQDGAAVERDGGHVVAGGWREGRGSRRDGGRAPAPPSLSSLSSPIQQLGQQLVPRLQVVGAGRLAVHVHAEDGAEDLGRREGEGRGVVGARRERGPCPPLLLLSPF